MRKQCVIAFNNRDCVVICCFVVVSLVGFDLPDERLPRIDIRVMDESGNSTDAGEGVFGSQVQMYLDVVDPNGSETTNPGATPLGFDPDNPDDTDEEVSF